MQNLEISLEERIQHIRDCVKDGDLVAAKFHLEQIPNMDRIRPDVHELTFCLSIARGFHRDLCGWSFGRD
jgi:hypothetical protein